MTRPAKITVLEFTNALHNYRRDPSPSNLVALMSAGDVICTNLGQVSEQLELEREKVPAPRELCSCGGRFQPDPNALSVYSFVAIKSTSERCDCCNLRRVTALYSYSPGRQVDAG